MSTSGNQAGTPIVKGPQLLAALNNCAVALENLEHKIDGVRDVLALSPPIQEGPAPKLSSPTPALIETRSLIIDNLTNRLNKCAAEMERILEAVREI